MTGKPSVWQSMRLQKVGHNLVTEQQQQQTQPKYPNKTACAKLRHMCHLNIQFSSVAQSCPTLCNPMNCSTPGLLVHHQLPESTQTHVHRVGDAIQPSHPLSSSSPALNLSQRQGLFK